MTPKELKILLVLNGSKRLEHLEIEIFKKKQLVVLYMVALSNGWHNVEDLKIRNNVYWFTYYHAKIHLKNRWYNAEEFIKKDKQSWNCYCRFFDIMSECDSV